MKYLDIRTIFFAVVLTSLMSGGQTLQCFNCEEFKMNGKVSDQYSTPCEGSAVTCKEGDLCLTSEYSFNMKHLGRDIKGQYSGTRCSKEMGEDEGCEYLKNALKNEFDETLEDFECEVRFCDTDFCTHGSSGETAKTSFLVVVSLVVFHGIYLFA